MGTSQSIQKVSFEDVLYATQNYNSYLLINTLNINEQQCLIKNTVQIEKEELLINELLKTSNKNIKIIIYGKNCNDESIYKKYDQLIGLGFKHVYLYLGGLFEWLMLQDIYGNEDFVTTKKELDILKYKPNKTLNIHLIEY